MLGGICKHDTDPVACADGVALKISCGNAEPVRKIGVADHAIPILDGRVHWPVMCVMVDDVCNVHGRHLLQLFLRACAQIEKVINIVTIECNGVCSEPHLWTALG